MMTLLLTLAVATAAAESGLPPAPAELSRIALSDGQVLIGQAQVLGDGTVQVTLHDGVTFTLPAEAVTSVELEATSTTPATSWGLDPNRSRYLYSPTAFALGQGNGYVAQRALVLTSAAVGLTDFLDVEAGVVLPFLFTGQPLAAVGAKLAAPVHDHVRVGVGAQALFLPERVTGMLAFANTTVGTADSHGTLATGAVLDVGGGELMAWAGTLGGSHRLGPKAALITENWFFWFVFDDGPWDTPLYVVPSGGMRLFGPSFAVDLALVPVVTGEFDVPVVPLPWVSFAWNWSVKP